MVAGYVFNFPFVNFVQMHSSVAHCVRSGHFGTGNPANRNCEKDLTLIILHNFKKKVWAD